MKRWLVYAGAVAALLMLRPEGSLDVSGILPVELLYIHRDGKLICAETDVGALGMGTNLEAALNDLEATAEGRVFLETADYLIVTPDTVKLLPQLTNILRPGAEVCLGYHVDTQAVSYLKAHPCGVTLQDYRAGQKDLPTLIRSKERYHFGKWKNIGQTA